MFHGELKNGLDMVVRQRINHVFSVAPRADEVTLPEDAKLMRNGGLRHIQDVRQVADAHFMGIERRENADARTVAEDLEEVGEIVIAFVAMLLRADELDDFRVDRVAVGEVCGEFGWFFLVHVSPFFLVEQLNS